MTCWYFENGPFIVAIEPAKAGSPFPLGRMENAVKLGAVFSVNNISTPKKRPKAASAWRNNRSPVRGVPAERKMSVISWPLFFFLLLLRCCASITELTGGWRRHVARTWLFFSVGTGGHAHLLVSTLQQRKIRSTWGHSTAWVSDFCPISRCSRVALLKKIVILFTDLMDR